MKVFTPISIEFQYSTPTISGGSITNKQFAQDWHLDPTGNWATFKQDDDGNNTWDLNQSCTHNEVNEITGITGGSWVAPVHDRPGNMTTMPRPALLSSPYHATYDAWNRLVKVTDGANTVAEYAYDGMNRRTVKKTYTSGSLTETRDFYYSDRWQVIEERVTISAVRKLERQFVWGLRYVDDLILRDVFDTTSGSLLNRRYACQDANFNVVAITDTSGSVTQRFKYEAYGVSTAQDAAFTPASNTEWEIRYAGYRWDTETGLYQVRMRYLHSEVGRWITRDPLEYQGNHLNQYQYTANSPLSFSDDTGLKDCKITIYFGHNYSIRSMVGDDFNPGGGDFDIPPGQCIVGVGCGAGVDTDGDGLPDSMQDYIESNYACNSINAPKLLKLGTA